MKVLVDAPIWSYALRSKRRTFEGHVAKLEQLIADQRVLIIGPICQEILSGYGETRAFEQLRKKLGFFENTPMTDDDFVEGARLYNRCRKQGVQGSHIDLLICAVSIRLKVEIFTTDKDFYFYQKHLPIKLHAA